MALNIQKKKHIVTKIHEIASLAKSVILSEIQNISTNNITQLRQSALQVQVKVNVVKNTLLKLAFKNTPYDCLIKDIQGPNLIAFSMKNPGSAARLLKDFEKRNANFKIKIGVFEKKILSQLEINELANMPTYKESIIQIIVVLQEITVRKLIRILTAIQFSKSI